MLKNESRAIVDVVSSSLKRIQSSLLGDKDCSDDKSVIAKAAAKIKEQIQANADKAKRKQALGKSSGGLMESLGVVPVDKAKGRSNKSDRRMDIDSDGSMDIDSGSEAVPAKASKSTPKSAAARKPRASAKASAAPPAIQPAAAKRTARSAAKVRAQCLAAP